MKNKYQPYIRRANGRERAGSFRDWLRLEAYRETGKPYYVMVQRGFPNHVMNVGASKHAIKQSILLVGAKRTTFPKWARSIQRRANPRSK